MENSLFTLEEEELCIAGADEAGRGPLAGPVTAACVILPPDFPFSILGDSKKLSEKKRIEAEKIIKEKAIAWAVSSVSHRIIDKINILNASMSAMALAYSKVSVKKKADILLVDGNRVPEVPVPCRAVVKGDSKINEIMAASILAKNYRDRLMLIADRRWPQYGYARHKGYPTKEHLSMIKLYGPSPIQRLSFSAGLDSEENEPELF